MIPSKGRTARFADREVVDTLKQHKVDLILPCWLYAASLSPGFVHGSFRSASSTSTRYAFSRHFLVWKRSSKRFAYGAKVSGCTVRFPPTKSSIIGAIVVQKTVAVLGTDDGEHALAERILEQEHIAYTEAINIVLQGNYDIVGRRLVSGSPAGLSP